MTEDPVELSQRLALALHRATALVDRVAEVYLRPAHGIGTSAFAALVTIDALEPARQTDLARGLDVSRAAVTQRLADLSARGLVEVHPDPTDARANVVSLSAAGRALLRDAWAGLARQDDGLEAGVDLEVLLAGLDAVIANATRFLGAEQGGRA